MSTPQTEGDDAQAAEAGASGGDQAGSGADGGRRVGGLTPRPRADAPAPLARLSRAARQAAKSHAGAQSLESSAMPESQATHDSPDVVVAINARISADVRDRARTAFLATQLTEARTFSEFVERALIDRIAALEAQYNHGTPWAPTSRALKPGPS